jgi:6-phosphogluconolactonase
MLCDVIAKRIASLCREAIDQRGKFTIALAGGLTPKGIYTRLSSAEYRNQIEWHKIHFFWGDERWVPPDDIKSNYRMVADSLLTRVDLSGSQIHFVNTKTSDPETSARLYETDLKQFFQAEDNAFPVFDLMLLGVGQDGHIASLFPKNKALSEKKHWVVAVTGDSHDEPRITLTLPVINHSRHIFFSLSGREKANIVHTVFETNGHSDLPVTKVHPVNGHVVWYMDQPAASLLQSREFITIS